MTTTARLEAWIVSIVLYGSVIAVLTFFYISIVALIAFSFQEGTYFSIPFEGFSLRWYSALFTHKDFGSAVRNSAAIALAVTVLSTAVGTCAALAWVRYTFRFKHAFQFIVAAPLFFAPAAAGDHVAVVVLGVRRMVRLLGRHAYGDHWASSLHRTVCDHHHFRAAPRIRPHIGGRCSRLRRFHVAGLQGDYFTADLARYILCCNLQLPTLVGKLLHYLQLERNGTHLADVYLFRHRSWNVFSDLPGPRHHYVCPRSYPGVRGGKVSTSRVSALTGRPGMVLMEELALVLTLQCSLYLF